MCPAKKFDGWFRGLLAGVPVQGFGEASDDDAAGDLGRTVAVNTVVYWSDPGGPLDGLGSRNAEGPHAKRGNSLFRNTLSAKEPITGS